jgi:hypothetical protein
MRFPKEALEFPSSSSEEELERIEEAERVLIRNEVERNDVIEKRTIVRELARYLKVTIHLE